MYLFHSCAAFQWDDFAAKNNAELNDNLGNFINRTLKFIYARWVERCRVWLRTAAEGQAG